MGKCLLCNTFQKLYNALDSLDGFEVSNDFFKNISAIDKFFIEFRNVTFVLQKSLSNANKMDLYNLANEKFLLHDPKIKWFVEKRNMVCKEESFDLVKWLLIVVYENGFEKAVCVERFDLENDISKEIIQTSLCKVFDSYNIPIIYGTAFLAFAERNNKIELGSDDEIQIKLLYGIEKIIEFLEFIKKELDEEECVLCKELIEKIKKLYQKINGLDIQLTRDFEYINKSNRIEFTEKCEFRYELESKILKQEELLMSGLHFDGNKYNIENYFYNFMMMHLGMYQQTKEILPTFMILYSDNSYRFISFALHSKANLYRYLNQISKKMVFENIKAVFYVGEVYMKIKNSEMDIKKEGLMFASIYDDLSEIGVCFEKEKIENINHISSILSLVKVNNSSFNWGPIKKVFENKKEEI